jgi:hypothetical protein
MTATPRPLLRGRAAEQVHDALRRISRALLEMPSRPVRDPSLADGGAGFALAHTALAPLFPRSGHLDRAEEALDRSIAALSRTPVSPYLYAGFTGVAWAVEHLRGDSGEDANEAIDEALLLYLTRTPWTESFDLIRGLAGYGVYALERLPRPGARRILELVVDRLAETARRRRPGLAWWSDPEWVAPQFRRTPHLAWNLGLAHGVPGVIGVLAGALGAGIQPRTTRRLLDGAVRWLLAQEIPRRTDAGFAIAVGPGLERAPARSAWCYGDPGVAAALLAAATAVGEPAWKKHALRMALRAAERAPSACKVVDAGLCHGAAGLGHVFHRMYLTSGDPRLARAARAWLVRALDYRQARGGIAGFASWGPDERGRMTWLADPGMLTGVAGIGLAFAAALSGADPTWDRALLLSLRATSSAPA